MILKGDCIEVMKAIKPNSVDAIVCDPPYGLEFMGKEWDKLYPNKGKWKGQEHKPTIENRKDSPYLRSAIKQPAYLLHCVNCGGNSSGEWNRCKCDNPQFKIPDKVRLAPQIWHTQWLTEAHKVLKPGGSMLVMGGTRTSHRLACAIEDSGFIIKDTIMFMYGSGFPKAQDLGKMIDKRGGQSLKRFGKLLKEARIKKGLSQKDIAKHFPSKTGGLTGCVWNWEEGTNAPTIEEVNKLIEILDIKEARVKEVMRGVIGKDKTFGDSWFSEKHEFDLTSPNTDLAKHWDGFKVGGIKPAYEPIIWAVKPPEGSYVDNILKWGVGAVNVDECRIGYQNKTDYEYTKAKENKSPETKAVKNPSSFTGTGQFMDSKGRFPANVILSHHPECVQVGMKRVKGQKAGTGGGFKTDKYSGTMGRGKYTGDKFDSRADPDGFEIVESWVCVENCPIRLLDEQSGDCKTGGRKIKTDCGSAWYKQNVNVILPSDNGSGASRFYYCAKSSRSERNKGLDNTVLIDIMKVCNGKNITKQESLVRLLVDTDILPLRATVVSGTKNKSVSEWSMSWFGKNILEKYQKENGFITKTGTSSIMISQILKYLICLLTKEYTADVKLSKGNGGSLAENVENSNQLIITISESLASRLGVRNVASETQLKISVKEGRCEHPTVKPVSLFEYLIKLVTRQGQVVLDPFVGSGTTAIAAHNTGRKCVGIEKEDEYLTIAKRRIDYWQNQPKQKILNLGV